MAAPARDFMKRKHRRLTRLPVLLLAGFAACAPSAFAQDAARPAWRERKCELYADAWADAVRIQGLEGIGPGFREQHDAFLASGCSARVKACPSSAEELALADLLSLMAISEGMTGSFLPFACPD